MREPVSFAFPDKQKRSNPVFAGKKDPLRARCCEWRSTINDAVNTFQSFDAFAKSQFQSKDYELIAKLRS